MIGGLQVKIKSRYFVLYSTAIDLYIKHKSKFHYDLKAASSWFRYKDERWYFNLLPKHALQQEVTFFLIPLVWTHTMTGASVFDLDHSKVHPP